VLGENKTRRSALCGQAPWADIGGVGGGWQKKKKNLDTQSYGRLREGRRMICADDVSQGPSCCRIKTGDLIRATDELQTGALDRSRDGTS